ncbi:hypothetical protein PENSPDRAFT_684058 [Peniophora sp. CONT]|nr:hypothetical protein PENSPDRAFT_684058 [Peniophora sp. CONT]
MDSAQLLDHSSYIIRNQGVGRSLTSRALNSRDGLASTDPTHFAHRSDAYLAFWFMFQILGGQVLMLVLIGTFLFTRARRHMSLVNLCASFVLTGICSSLLLYAGQLKGPEPNLTLCIFQAAAANALPPLWSTALLFFVFYLRKSINDPDGKELERPSVWSFLAIVLPYVVFLIYLLVGCILGSLHPEKVTRDDRAVYCDNNNDAFDVASASYSALAAVASLSLTAPLAVNLIRAYPWFRKLRNATATQCLALRLCEFLVFVGIGIVFAVWSNFNDVNASSRDMYIAITPVAIFLVFGSQADVLSAWCFWRRRPTTADEWTSPDYPTRVLDIGRKLSSEKILPDLPRSPKSFISGSS